MEPSKEVSELALKMKLDIGGANVRQRYNNASLAMKVKYKRAVWKNAMAAMATFI
ncbi:hypothetical protein D3C85_14170 [compost metagenome]